MRKLNLKKHFALNQEDGTWETPEYVQTNLKNNSIYNPKTPASQCMNAFKKMVEEDLRNLRRKDRKGKHTWDAIKKLGERHEVIIRPADKGGGLVILDKKDYQEEMENLLKVENTYQRLRSNPKKKYQRKLKTFIDKGKKLGILNLKEAEYLFSRSTKTPIMYYTPKIHKRLHKPPGRPIISGVNSIFSRLGEYLDKYLKPIVQKGKSYLRDSQQLIQELQGIQAEGNWILATIDVNSLYTSIVQKDGLAGVEKTLHEKTGMKQQQINYILEGLKMAMECNYFWYSNNYYVQTKGVAMGARYAPSVANLFLDMWEEEYIYNQQIPQIKLYRRYIDDLIILWDGTPDTFEEFLQQLNINKYGITFTGKWNLEKIEYLDLEIFKTGTSLYTRTFFKETDRNGYIPNSSCHHPRWKGNIPKGQLMRLRRNCDLIADFDKQADMLIQRFQEKGYAANTLAKLKSDVMKMDRKTLLNNTRKRRNEQGEILFITGYNNQYKDVERIIHRYWPILQEDRVLSKILPRKPKFVYRRAPNLRNFLVHNAVDPPKQVKISTDLKGFYKCRRCLACRVSKPQPRKRATFKSTVDHKQYKIRKLITCQSTHVTYIIECPCHLQYVGRTTRPLAVRIREHINNIKKGFPKHHLSRHFDKVHQRDPTGLVFYGIDHVEDHWRGNNKLTLISQNETEWIYRLQSLAPRGLNLDIDLNCFIANP